MDKMVVHSPTVPASVSRPDGIVKVKVLVCLGKYGLKDYYLVEVIK